MECIIKEKQNSLVSVKELRAISKQLFDKLPNTILKTLNLNFQAKKYSNNKDDQTSEP
jgi:hypothetical protein